MDGDKQEGEREKPTAQADAQVILGRWILSVLQVLDRRIYSRALRALRRASHAGSRSRALVALLSKKRMRNCSASTAKKTTEPVMGPLVDLAEWLRKATN